MSKVSKESASKVSDFRVAEDRTEKVGWLYSHLHVDSSRF